MRVRWEHTEVHGHSMRVYVGAPDGGPHPVILVAQHAGGVDEPIQDAVHRLARAGYVAAAPELFHRQPEGPIERLKRAGMVNDDELVADMQATLALVEKTVGAIGPVGMTGFCMGGRVAYLLACVEPRIAATVVFYGGNIRKAMGEGPSPFERSAGIRGPMLGLFAGEDTNPSPDDVAALSAELTRLGKWHEFHTYKGAGHAFQNFNQGDRYRPRAARASWEEMLAFFDAHLRGR
jgi:carboxymethylenebutenolidase